MPGEQGLDRAAAAATGPAAGVRRSGPRRAPTPPSPASRGLLAVLEEPAARDSTGCAQQREPARSSARRGGQHALRASASRGLVLHGPRLARVPGETHGGAAARSTGRTGRRSWGWARGARGRPRTTPRPDCPGTPWWRRCANSNQAGRKRIRRPRAYRKQDTAATAAAALSPKSPMISASWSDPQPKAAPIARPRRRRRGRTAAPVPAGAPRPAGGVAALPGPGCARTAPSSVVVGAGALTGPSRYAPIRPGGSGGPASRGCRARGDGDRGRRGGRCSGRGDRGCGDHGCGDRCGDPSCARPCARVADIGSIASDRSSIGRASPVAPLTVCNVNPPAPMVSGAAPVGTIHQSRHSGT
ncbi:hypothetical protein SHIRM173S_06453 [Streptomyces hirsutus]